MHSRKWQDQFQKLQDASLYGDQEKLYKYIKENFTIPLYKGNNERPTRIFLRSNIVAQQLQLQEEREFKQAELQRKIEEGDLSDYFHEKDEQIKLQQLQRQQNVYRAALSNIRVPISVDQIANQISKTNLDQALLLINRNKPWLSVEEQRKEDVKTIISGICDEIQQKNEQIIQTQQRSPKKLTSIEAYQTEDTQFNLNTLKFSMVGIMNDLQEKVQSLQSLQENYLILKKEESIEKKFIKSLMNKIALNNLFTKFKDDKELRFGLKNVEQNLHQKIEFSQMCKQTANKPRVQGEIFQDDHRWKYFNDCKQAIEPAKNIFSLIDCGDLQIHDEHLNFGQCNGFKSACEIEDTLVTSLLLQNCSIDDINQAKLFEGLIFQNKVKKVILRHQIIKIESAKVLNQLIAKYAPNNVEDFKIEHCQIQANVLQVLLEQCVQESQIENLSLIDVPLDYENIKLLVKLIQNGLYLKSLNLSFNKLTFPQIKPIIDAISNNQRLMHINLSWNNLVEGNNFGNLGSLCENSSELQERQTNRKRKMPDLIPKKRIPKKQKLLEIFGEEKIFDNKDFNTNEMFIVKSLQNLLCKNVKLLHLDLSECGLTGDMILEFSKAIKYSSCLISLHLSGNPGLTHNVQESLMLRLKATHEKQFKIQSLQQYLNRNQDQEVHRSKQLLEAIQIKKIQQAKRFYETANLGEINDVQQRHYILTRKIGHKYDIPGSYNWQIFTDSQDQCYVCDRKIYTIFLWSPEFGAIQSDDFGLSHDQKQSILDFILNNRETSLKREEIRVVHPDIYKSFDQLRYNDKDENLIENNDNNDVDSQSLSDESENENSNNVITNKLQKGLSRKNQKNIQNNQFVIQNKHRQKGNYIPMLYGQFNNWQPQPMLKLFNLVQYLNREEFPDFIQKMKDIGICSPQITKPSQMNSYERKAYCDMKRNYDEEQSKFQMWARNLTKLVQYNYPHCNISDNLQDLDSRQIYISAEYLSCGRQDYVIQYGKQFYFNQTIANFRSEDIKIPPGEPRQPEKILRNPNVFKLWQLDTNEIIESSSKADFEGWKVTRFVKDPQEYKEICNILSQNYLYLKDSFVSLTARYNYPSMSTIDFSTLLIEADLIDSKTSTGIIDTQFISSRQDAESRGMKLHNQNPNEINRFEFFETLVRVAGCKYMQQGITNSWSKSFQLLIDHLKKFYQPYPIQIFREQLLWTRDVNLTLDANKEGIIALYERYSVKSKIGKMSKADAHHLMTRETKIQLSEKDATICYALSLWTCVNIVKTSHVHIDHITLLEFLELIGRVSDVFLNESDMRLYEKINYVLDQWLMLVGYQRKEPQQYEDVNFEASDHDAEIAEKNRLIKLKRTVKQTKV